MKECPTCGSGCGIRYSETGATCCETCRGTGRVESDPAEAAPLRMEGRRMAEIIANQGKTMSHNTGQQLDLTILRLERELAFARDSLKTALEASRAKIAALKSQQTLTCKFAPGDLVEKTSGDYTFRGVVRAVFAKQSGAVRLVVEDERGLLFIFNEGQLAIALVEKTE